MGAAAVSRLGRRFGLVKFLIKLQPCLELLIQGLAHDDELPFTVPGHENRIPLMAEANHLMGFVAKIGDWNNARNERLTL